MGGRNRFSWVILGLSAVAAVSCAQPDNAVVSCADSHLTPVASNKGAAALFFLDPIIASKDPTISPTSLKLDSLVSPASLQDLGGLGVLEGQYVDVRSGVCGEWYSAYAKDNQFNFTHEDPHFQEAMTYYYGDRYRAHLDTTGYLAPSSAVRIVAHCMLEDNAYYARGVDANGQPTDVNGKVCLGDSVATPGASYADDATVTTHELQHATTMNTYSPSENLNQFWYDEAGALNEAVSDFMSLAQTEPDVSANGFDPRVFSRWALDRFVPLHKGTRGAHRCPAYDANFGGGCSGFPNFQGDGNVISYVYPDGLGWPYANNYSGSSPAKSAFTTYGSQEEIHNAGVLLVGALYDVYDALRAAHGSASAFDLSTKLVHEALKHLPKPTSANLSPVTFRGFAAAIVSAANLLNLSSSDQAAVTQALTARGLVGGTPVPASWTDVGAGKSATPGLRIQDSPSVLKSWLMRMGTDPSAITQDITTGLNEQLDPGEFVAVWFDLKNVSSVTAGAVLLSVSTTDPEIVFADNRFNAGAIDGSHAQILYGKINGTSIVQAMGSIPTGNSYFGTNPFYDHSWVTAIFVKVSPAAAHGKVVHFTVSAAPSNGTASTSTFAATIR